MVQWLRLLTSTAGGMGLMPGQGTKVLNAVQRSQTKNLKAINDLKNDNKAWRLSGDPQGTDTPTLHQCSLLHVQLVPCFFHFALCERVTE